MIEISYNISAVSCEHANEVPVICTCLNNCYCKAHTCKIKMEKGYDPDVPKAMSIEEANEIAYANCNIHYKPKLNCQNAICRLAAAYIKKSEDYDFLKLLLVYIIGKQLQLKKQINKDI